MLSGLTEIFKFTCPEGCRKEHPALDPYLNKVPPGSFTLGMTTHGTRLVGSKHIPYWEI